MTLTGKCKKDFEKWLKKQKFGITQDVVERQMNIVNLALLFEQLPLSMKFGVYADFFDSVNIYIGNDGIDYKGLEFSFNIQEKNTINGNNGYIFKTRPQSRIEAIKEANEIYNK